MILQWFKHDKAGDYELYRVWNRSVLMAPGLKCVKWSMTRAVKNLEKHTLGDFFKTDDEITQLSNHNVYLRNSKWQVVLLIEAFKIASLQNSLLINYKRYLYWLHISSLRNTVVFPWFWQISAQWTFSFNIVSRSQITRQGWYQW